MMNFNFGVHYSFKECESCMNDEDTVKVQHHTVSTHRSLLMADDQSAQLQDVSLQVGWSAARFAAYREGVSVQRGVVLYRQCARGDLSERLDADSCV